LLLLLAERADHGYDLVARLSVFGLESADAASTYRALRGLEGNGSVTSCWTPSPAGPARRVYHLTSFGRVLLAEYGQRLRQDQIRVAGYLRRLDAVPDVRCRVVPSTLERTNSANRR
jgi:DNA-binding PadR family transcriptional regulator